MQFSLLTIDSTSGLTSVTRKFMTSSFISSFRTTAATSFSSHSFAEMRLFSVCKREKNQPLVRTYCICSCKEIQPCNTRENAWL